MVLLHVISLKVSFQEPIDDVKWGLTVFYFWETASGLLLSFVEAKCLTMGHQATVQPELCIMNCVPSHKRWAWAAAIYCPINMAQKRPRSRRSCLSRGSGSCNTSSYCTASSTSICTCAHLGSCVRPADWGRKCLSQFYRCVCTVCGPTQKWTAPLGGDPEGRWGRKSSQGTEL